MAPVSKMEPCGPATPRDIVACPFSSHDLWNSSKRKCAIGDREWRRGCRTQDFRDRKRFQLSNCEGSGEERDEVSYKAVS